MGWKAKMMKALVFLTAAKERTTAAAWHTAAIIMVEREGYLRESQRILSVPTDGSTTLAIL
jgi:hypothetical protein